MRKKFTMLLTALLCCVGGANAQYYVIKSIGDNITKLEDLTENSFVALYNVGKSKYIYENATDNKLLMGTGATIEAGHEYIWQVKKNGEKFLFVSASGKYFSTPLDGNDVFTVASDNAAKDEFTIVTHDEDNSKWKVQSSNNSAIYWDAQDARFVGWSGSGTNSQYEIRPITVDAKYTIEVLYQRNGVIVCKENSSVSANGVFVVTAPIFTSLNSCSADKKAVVVSNENGTYTCTINEDATTITAEISESSLGLSQTYYLKDVASGLFMTIVEAEKAEGVQIKSLETDNGAQIYSFVETMTKNGYQLKSQSGCFLTASSFWDYSAVTTTNSNGGDIHIVEEAGDGVYYLKSMNGYVSTNESAHQESSPMYSNHPKRTTNSWEFVSTAQSADAILKEEMVALKEEASSLKASLEEMTASSTPFTEFVESLGTLIQEVENNSTTTNTETLNGIIAELKAALQTADKIKFEGGVLAALGQGEYVIYYEAEDGTKYYLGNVEGKVQLSVNPTIYDVTNGIVSDGYVNYAYFFKMNDTRISNPTNDDEKKIQTNGSERLWESQVLYVNAEGKYAIRSTNCTAGSGYNCDAFITISEDDATVIGQNTDLSDALYKWKIEKVTGVAGIDKLKYPSLKAAIAAATDGATVKLIADISSPDIIVIDKPMTLDGNGKTLTSTAERGININVDGEVTVKDLTMTVTGERGFNIIQKPCTTNIQGVTATAANYAVNVASSAGAAVVNITDSHLTGLNVVNIGGPGSTITVDECTLVCNDQSNDESYAALALNKDAIGAKITATDVNFDIKGDSKRAGNGAEGGTITIDNSSDEVAKFVAAIEYGDYYYSFESLAAAVAYAEEGETVKLIADVELSDMVKIEKPLTLDLGGKNVRAASQKAFEVYANATIKNGSIEALQRCVDTRKAVELNLTDLSLTADEYHEDYGNPQPLTIGGSDNGTKVTISDSEISAQSGYGIISFVKTEVAVTNTSISGYNALYVKPGSESSTFTFTNSTLAGSTGSNDVEGNSFSTIAVRANNVTITADANSTITATGNYCHALSFGGTYSGEQTTTDNRATIAATITGNILANAYANDNTIKINANHAATLQEEGYVVSEPTEGLVQVTGVAIAKVGDTNYATLQDAIDAADADATVTLIDDIEISSAVQVADVITLDLNGKSITRAEGYVFEVTGELTVTGGTIAQRGICYIINDADYKTAAGKTYAISEDKEYVDIEYTRTFGHDSWQVLFVPFDIKVTEELLNDFEVYTITGVNSERVTVEEVTDTEGTLSAHTPYLIKVQNWTEETKTRTITITGATLKAAPVKDITWECDGCDGYTFYGTYAPKAISEMKEYVLTDGQWCQLTKTAVDNNANILGAFRVYLTAPNGTQANALSITRGETGIEELSTVNDQQSTVIYDLTGRKVETMDKGIYIVNGRKVVIK